MIRRGTILTLMLLAALVRAEPTTQPTPGATTPNATTPEATVNEFLMAANAGDIATMVTMLGDADNDKVRERLQQMSDELTSGKTRLSVMESIVEADVAAVIIKTANDRRKKPEAIPLVKMGDAWKLVMEPNNTGIDADHVARLNAISQRARERARELRQQMAPPKPPTSQPAP